MPWNGTDNVYPDTSFSVLDLILNEISNEIEIEREYDGGEL